MYNYSYYLILNAIFFQKMQFNIVILNVSKYSYDICVDFLNVSNFVDFSSILCLLKFPLTKKCTYLKTVNVSFRSLKVIYANANFNKQSIEY